MWQTLEITLPSWFSRSGSFTFAVDYLWGLFCPSAVAICLPPPPVQRVLHWKVSVLASVVCVCARVCVCVYTSLQWISKWALWFDRWIICTLFIHQSWCEAAAKKKTTRKWFVLKHPSPLPPLLVYLSQSSLPIATVTVRNGLQIPAVLTTKELQVPLNYSGMAGSTV